MNHVTLVCYYVLYFMLSFPYSYSHIQHGVSMLIFIMVSDHLPVAMVLCPYGTFKSNLCLPRCFFTVFIFFGFLLLTSKLSGIIKPPLEVASTLQDHCLPQTTATKSNFIEGIFSTLSNLKISGLYQ